MQDNESQTLAETLSSRLRKGVTGWDDFQEAAPEEAWHAANSLAHALAGRELEYLSGKVSSRREKMSVDIVAYTSDFLIRVVSDPDTDYADSWIKSRGELRNIEVVRTPDVLPRPIGVPQSTASYKLFYGKYPLWLPVVGGGSEGLEAFAPSLWDDLIK